MLDDGSRGKCLPFRRLWSSCQGWKIAKSARDHDGFLSLTSFNTWNNYVNGNAALPFHVFTNWTSCSISYSAS